VRRTLTRIVFSLAGAAALATFAQAQEPPVVRPSPLTYDVKIQPWPSKPRPSQAMGSPFTPPEAGFVPPPPPPLIDTSKSAGSTSMKTLYYKKDSHAPVKPSAAAELTRPVAAEGQQPAPETAQPRSPSEGLPTTVKDPLIPTPEKLFRLDAEVGFQKYINAERERLKADPNVKQEDKKNLDPLDFPVHKAVPGGEGPYLARAYPQREEVIEPNYVLYRRLLFEDVNVERYGWTLGPLQPFVSTYEFYGQVQWLPYRYFSFPCLKHDTGAGRCLPGDPVPSMIYPPSLSITGALAQAGTTVALYAIIP